MKRHILMHIISALLGAALLAGCASAPGARSSAVADGPAMETAAVITDIRVQDNKLVITASKDFTYTLYKAGDPYKATIDIPDMKTGTFSGRITPDRAGISEVLPQQVEGSRTMTRIDITLQSPASIIPLYKDNVLTLLVKAEEPAAAAGEGPRSEPAAAEQPMLASVDPEPAAPAADTGPESAAPSQEQPAPLPRATEIDRVEVEKTEDGVRVLISGNGYLMPNVFPIDGRIVIDVPEVSMRAAIPKTVIAPLKGIRSGKHNDKVRLVLDLGEKTKFDVAAAGNAIEISLGRREGAAAVNAAAARPAPPPAAEPAKPAAAEQKPAPALRNEKAPEITSIPESSQGEGRFKGKKISLDFQDAEIGPIFRLLADVNGYNLVLDPTVKGRITIKLMNVPWDQALDIILNTFNLGKSIEGNILWIAPTSTFAKIAEEKNKARETEERAEELMQEIIRINYASAQEVQTAINSGKLLSIRGTITPDNRMNTLIIKDTPRSIENVKELVKIMDVSKPQVMIEARLVQVSSDYSQTLGIQWGGSFSSITSPGAVGGNFSVNTPVIGAGPATTNPGGVLGMTFGYANTVKVDLSLQALETLRKAKTLSNPKVLTMDNEAATIQQGSTFFIATVSQAGTQTQQQQATLSLNVTPKITPDGYVQLKVTATDNALVSVNPPVVDTKSLTTQALVKNGETLVLGGIYTSSKTEDETGVPLLSKIPGLGWLFKTKNQTGPTVRELLIFITPTIVGRNASI